MARDNSPTNDYITPLLEIGPFGGLDPTTEPFFVSPSNFISGENFVPNNGYGGFVTVEGRMPFLAAPLPGQCTGMFQCDRKGLPTVYFFAITLGGQGYIYYAIAGGTAVPLTLPETLTPDLQTSFASSLQWVFLTNGMDTPLKINVTTLTVTYWGIVAPTTAPTLAASGTSTMVGMYTYAVTFGTGSQESSQGAISATLTVTNQGIQLSAIPVSTDPQVTQRNIYRIGGSLGQWLLITTLNDNTTTTYLDTTGDAQVTGQQLVIYRDPPMPFTSICNHMERIWGFGTPNDASIVYWSNLNEPWGFNVDTGNLPIGENSFNDAAVACVSIGGQLVLHKSKTTYAVFGNTDSNFLANKLFDIGCRSLRSACTAYGLDWWVSRQGIYFYDGSSPTNISDGGYQQSNIKAILDGLTDADLAQATSFVYERMFHVSFPTLNKTYLYDLRSKNWYQMGWALDQVSFNLESTLYPVLGTNLETLYQIDTWFAAPGDFGQPIISQLTSMISDSGQVAASKIYRYVEIEAVPTEATVFFSTTANPGAGNYNDVQGIDLSTAGPRYQLSLPMSIAGTSVQLNIRVQSAKTVHVQKFGVYGWIERMFAEND
jgi:hypothetical protein